MGVRLLKRECVLSRMVEHTIDFSSVQNQRHVYDKLEEIGGPLSCRDLYATHHTRPGTDGE